LPLSGTGQIIPKSLMNMLFKLKTVFVSLTESK